MYYIERTSEQQLTGVTVADAKLYIGLISDNENALIQRLINAATDYAEGLTGNIFRACELRVISDRKAIRLAGSIDEVTGVTIDGVDVTYTINGNMLVVDAVGMLTVEYKTQEWLPDGVAAFILQSTAEMYSRGVEYIAKPNLSLLNRYIIMSVC